MDKLEHIYEMQMELMKKYGFKRPVDINTKAGQNKIRQIMFFVAHELFEASEWLKMKPWRHTRVPTNIPEFEMEIADVLHFYIELCIYLGIDSNKLHELYNKKHSINLDRIKSNY